MVWLGVHAVAVVVTAPGLVPTRCTGSMSNDVAGGLGGRRAAYGAQVKDGPFGSMTAPSAGAASVTGSGSTQNRPKSDQRPGLPRTSVRRTRQR